MLILTIFLGATKNDIQKIGTKKPVCIIPNCIQDQEQVTIKPKTNQFVYLGRLVFYKNVEVVLHAFKTVANDQLYIQQRGNIRK